MYVKRYFSRIGKLELIAFVAGFVLMAFELIGARMLAPTIGSSTYVWTSVIGVIIAAMSAGYFIGGKVADKRNQPVDVALLCLAVALSIGIMLVWFDQTMEMIVMLQEDLRVRGVLASLLLFAPTSLLLGMLSPYLAKLNVRSLATSGRAVASLSALNSIGGITGTFVTGFIIFSYIGSREALVVLTGLAVGAGWLLVPRQLFKQRFWLSLAAMAFVILPLLQPGDVIRVDTPSANYEIKTAELASGNDQLRYLSTGPNGAQSGILMMQPDKLAFWYTQEIARVIDTVPAKKEILVLGGGAFTVPEYVAKKYPGSQVDVVEIDPHLPEIATAYFDYQQLPNVKIIGEDARTFVNTATKKYDVVVVDVYSDTSVPFSLLTREYSEALGAIMSADSTVIINAIAGRAGPCRELLQAVDTTYRAVAPHGFISSSSETRGEQRKNLIVAYAKQTREITGMEPLKPLDGPVYRDNFMPAERLQQACSHAD